jgi:hypothetical protein
VGKWPRIGSRVIVTSYKGRPIEEGPVEGKVTQIVPTEGPTMYIVDYDKTRAGEYVHELCELEKP